MPATWTTPRTWADLETEATLTAALMNTHIRDNEMFLKAPPSDNYEANEAGDYTTNSAVFADVDATNLALTITTAPGVSSTVMVGFHGTFEHDTPSSINLEIDVDGAPCAGDDGILRIRPTGAGGTYTKTVEFIRLITGLAANTAHTFKLQWKTAAGNATLHAGAGSTNGRDVHPQFWVREVS